MVPLLNFLLFILISHFILDNLSRHGFFINNTTMLIRSHSLSTKICIRNVYTLLMNLNLKIIRSHSKVGLRPS